MCSNTEGAQTRSQNRASARDDEAERAAIEGDMPRVDLDEHVGDAVSHPANGVDEPEQRGEHMTRVDALG